MIPLPLKSTLIEEKKNLVHLEVDGLYPGYGTTIGNTLRRVLMSSLQGAAVTKVKIKGVQHEFSTIPGVLEDVISIIMNIKQMRFKLHTDEPQKAILSVKGEKKAKGSDFKVSSQMELINKDCHIATLTSKKSEIEMELTVEKGIGYEMVEQRKEQKKLEIGVIPIDAIFSPVKRISFRVENMRVKDRTDFERLFLDIETDGTVEPKEVFLNATEILIDHFSSIKNSLQGEEKKEKEEKKDKKTDKKEERKEEKEDSSKKQISDLNISQRTVSVLGNGNIKTIAGILRKSEDDLMALEGMGEKGLKEIKKALKKLGLELKA
ncbi:MAG: DNA-directed RNA polymerase subunit alpha [Candidatus Pacebacteria bacterium]|nr:DNA-directed RNA polymerase subunit alpha [Candidatus Paceibacterota bacterium]MDD3072121.1 DNA-directed RNA polymerase subunit alpha [Candidatus Paceibacterota bacterium]MDD3728814.1 DNA-directed RNA polymerase subunit alpha [Candidatus Paceibacterota bacterium]MDD4201327.1 DNA-directed RNA polymerase subunit alpha [Candidatus Paceibacterota bacterium]MDD4466999.1 DNA-directed RNA polymerase subunit alpha [Candidatus Paceibacterota bacterium]